MSFSETLFNKIASGCFFSAATNMEHTYASAHQAAHVTLLTTGVAYAYDALANDSAETLPKNRTSTTVTEASDALPSTLPTERSGQQASSPRLPTGVNGKSTDLPTEVMTPEGIETRSKTTETESTKTPLSEKAPAEATLPERVLPETAPSKTTPHIDSTISYLTVPNNANYAATEPRNAGIETTPPNIDKADTTGKFSDNTGTTATKNDNIENTLSNSANKEISEPGNANTETIVANSANMETIMSNNANIETTVSNNVNIEATVPTNDNLETIVPSNANYETTTPSNLGIETTVGLPTNASIETTSTTKVAIATAAPTKATIIESKVKLDSTTPRYLEIITIPIDLSALLASPSSPTAGSSTPSVQSESRGSSRLSFWAIALIVIGVLAALVIGAAAISYFLKRLGARSCVYVCICVCVSV